MHAPSPAQPPRSPAIGRCRSRGGGLLGLGAGRDGVLYVPAGYTPAPAAAARGPPVPSRRSPTRRGFSSSRLIRAITRGTPSPEISGPISHSSIGPFRRPSPGAPWTRRASPRLGSPTALPTPSCSPAPTAIALGHGAGAESRRPLGVAVVGGLAFSQMITLYITPVVYTYLDALQKRLGRRKGLEAVQSPPAEQSPSPARA